jgi:glucose uptake protein
MYQPETYGIALSFMLISMICWGSWANTVKLTPGWPFQLFYWDYVLGTILASLGWGLTLGSAHGGATAFLTNLHQADETHILYAIAGGVVFNVANLLLVAAIEIAGLAVAFPVGIGLALVVGVLMNYVLAPKGNPLVLFLGVVLVVIAIVLDAMAYRRREQAAQAVSMRGLILCVVSGVLMGSFYPLITKAAAGPASLGPYSVAFVMALGILLCAIPLNTFFMKRSLVGAEPSTFGDYARSKKIWHLWAILGGAIWCTGAVVNFVASHAQIVGPAVSYAIGQGATMVSAVWGVFIWHEFANAPNSSRRLLFPMFVCFLAGLGLIAVVPLLAS